MHHLHENDPAAKFIKEGNYSTGSLRESEDADLAKPVEAATGKIKTLQIEKLTLQDLEPLYAGALARRLPKLRTVCDEFQKADAAYMASPKGKGFKPVFSATVAAIFASKHADFDKTIDDIAARASDKANPLPDPYTDVAKRFIVEHTAYRRITGRISATAQQATDNGNATTAAKNDMITTMHRLEGKLKDRHPNDSAEVELAFMPEEPKHGGKAAAPTPPAPTPPAPPQPPPAPTPQPPAQAQPPAAQQPTPAPQPQPPSSQQPTPHP